jgi:branched-chain amino acid transport system substrate-binding protein
VANDQSFIGVIGPAFSGESLAGGPTLDGAGIPFVTGSATNTTISQQGWTHWFRAQGNDNSQGPAAGAYIVQVLKPNCAYVTSDDSAYGKALAQIVETTTKAANVKTTTQINAVTTGQKDFSALITKIKASGCKAVFYGGYSPEAGLLVKQMAAAGLSGVTTVGGDGIKDSTFTGEAGSGGDGTIASCPCGDVTKSTDAAAQSFISDYTAKWGQPPGIYSSDYWDIAQMYIQAFKAGKTTRADLTSYFDTINYKGLSKTIAFQSNHELDPNDVKIYFYKDENSDWSYLGLSTDVLTGA